eukprot:COSAG04_NODE_91_length_26852_cov_8.609315_25_plen_178_part_00
MAEACGACPETMAALSQAPTMRGCSLGYAFFSVLAPGTRIEPHCAPPFTPIVSAAFLSQSEGSVGRLLSTTSSPLDRFRRFPLLSKARASRLLVLRRGEQPAAAVPRAAAAADERPRGDARRDRVARVAPGKHKPSPLSLPLRLPCAPETLRGAVPTEPNPRWLMMRSVMISSCGSG